MLAFWTPGTTELIIILIIALLLFGSRLPSVMRALGKSLNEFKKGMNEPGDEVAALPGEQAEAEPGDKDPPPAA